MSVFALAESGNFSQDPGRPSPGARATANLGEVRHIAQPSAMVTKSRLRLAIAAEKGVDFKKLKQTKKQKAALKRKRAGAERDQPDKRAEQDEHDDDSGSDNHEHQAGQVSQGRTRSPHQLMQPSADSPSPFPH